MPDAADVAQFHMEQMEKLNGAGHREKPPELPVTGECHNCQEPLGQGERFCDCDCRDDWKKRRGARARR